MQSRTLGKQLEDASDLRASWAIIVRKKELKSGLLTFKDMHARKEERLSLDEIKRKLSHGGT